jgi:DNA helicase IV
MPGYPYRHFKKILAMSEEGLKSMAVICKTMDECKAAYTALSKALRISV